MPRTGHNQTVDDATGQVAVIRTRSARSVGVNLALLRAFRRSPMDFLEVLVASGASTVPLQMGPERVLWLMTPPGLGAAHHARSAYREGPRAGTRATPARRRAAHKRG